MRSQASWVLRGAILPRSRLNLKTLSTQTRALPEDFTFFHNVLSVPEQQILLAAALDNLDQKESARFRRKRKVFGSRVSQLSNIDSVSSLFLPDEYYNFEEVRWYL